MKFRIDRTSGYEENEAPCDGAFQDTYARVDIRTVCDPAKIYRRETQNTDWWYKEGLNHRVLNGNIARDYPGEVGWFMNIDSLEDLLRFADKYGELIIGRSYGDPNLCSIEIYDTYRE